MKPRFKDAIVVIISLTALAALIFIVKNTNDRARREQELLVQTKSKIRSFFQQPSRYILLYTEEAMSWGGISNVSNDAISE